MVSYFKTHRWLATGLAAMVLVFGAACGGSLNDASSPGGDGGGSGPNSTDEKIAYSSQNYTELESGVARDSAAPSAGAIAPESEGGGGASPSTLPSTLDRKIIMTATLNLESAEVSKNFENAGNIAIANGGFVSSSSFGNSGEEQTASITIRVPSENYQRTLSELRKLGEVKGEQSGANDVTEEYTDLDSRLRSLKAVEAQYVEFLTRAVTIDDVLTVQDRLNSTRIEIEQVQGRINLLNNQTDLATITVHLDPPIAAKVTPVDDGKTTPVEALENGWEASLELLGGAAAVVLVTIAFSWWLVPVALVAGYFARKQAKAAKSSEVVASPPAA
jgi:hypothetical protein